MATVYFESGSALLPGDIGTTLEGVVAYAKANANAKLAVSGFHDATGSQEANAEISRNRAAAVAGVLKMVIGEERIELKKPVLTTGTGGSAEARRVEVQVM